jgi:hypothetical protein
MKKLPILFFSLFFFILFSAKSWAQNWNGLPDTLNGPITSAINTGTPTREPVRTIDLDKTKYDKTTDGAFKSTQIQ